MPTRKGSPQALIITGVLLFGITVVLSGCIGIVPGWESECQSVISGEKEINNTGNETIDNENSDNEEDQQGNSEPSDGIGGSGGINDSS